MKSVEKILQRDRQVDYLIVETTGVADPLPVALTFLGSNLRDQTRLDSIITLADCENFSLDKFEHSEAAISQFACADVVLLNKTDLVNADTIAKIQERIANLREGIRIIKTTNSQVPLPLILSAGLFESDRYFNTEKHDRHHEHNHNHDHHHEYNHDRSHHLESDGFISVSFEFDRPLNIRKYQYFLDNQLPPEVFRAKGFLWFGESEFKHIFHLSGKRFTITDEQWKTPPKNQLVLIGQNLKKEELKTLLQQCISP
jgi:G3E family GTPase